MSDTGPIFGHHITGQTEGHTLTLVCSCAQWEHSETYDPDSSPFNERSIVIVLQLLADAGRDHMLEVLTDHALNE